MLSECRSAQHSLKTLLNANKNFEKEYRNNTLMAFVTTEMMCERNVRVKLLDCIQVFSNYFQKVVMLRNCFCENPPIYQQTLEHLQEEFCHNVKLMADRGFRPPLWDSILEGTSSWFCWKMFNSSEEEKIVLVHLVLETSANIFFKEAHNVMHKYHETDYFYIHSEVDEKHEDMGREFLENLTTNQYQRLYEIQCQGWDMLNTICARIAFLCNTHTL